MRLIGIVISPNKIFKECKRWSKNRAFLKDNPNISRESLNPTYAMTDDDDVFFEKYFQSSVMDFLTNREFSTLQNKYTKVITNPIEYDYNQKKCALLLVVESRFPKESLCVLINDYVQWSVLYYWYWEKNLIEEMQLCKNQMQWLQEKIKDIVINSYADDDDKDGDKEFSKIGIIPYNDGFVINPPRRKRDLSNINTLPDYIGGQDTEVQEIVSRVVNPLILTIGEQYQLEWRFEPAMAKEDVAFKTTYNNIENNQYPYVVDKYGVVTAKQESKSLDDTTKIYLKNNENIFDEVNIIVKQALHPIFKRNLPSIRRIYTGKDINISIEVIPSINSNTVEYHWYFNGKEIENNNTAKTPNLIIKNANGDNEGEYYCKVYEDGINTWVTSNILKIEVNQNTIFQKEFNNVFE